MSKPWRTRWHATTESEFRVFGRAASELFHPEYQEVALHLISSDQHCLRTRIVQVRIDGDVLSVGERFQDLATS
jgi:hypothetical protein